MFLSVYISIILEEEFMKIMLQYMSESIRPMFPSRSFTVSGLSFRSLIHFGFIFVHNVKEESTFPFSHVAAQFSQHHLLKRLSF